MPYKYFFSYGPTQGLALPSQSQPSGLLLKKPIDDPHNHDQNHPMLIAMPERQGNIVDLSENLNLECYVVDANFGSLYKRDLDANPE
jgi:hypothetical protein